ELGEIPGSYIVFLRNNVVRLGHDIGLRRFVDRLGRCPADEIRKDGTSGKAPTRRDAEHLPGERLARVVPSDRARRALEAERVERDPAAGAGEHHAVVARWFDPPRGGERIERFVEARPDDRPNP